MGYTTDFEGEIAVEPPLNEHEIAYLKKFSESRRMDRTRGPFFIGSGSFGQDHAPDIRDYNNPGDGQPGLWCNWEPTDDGRAIRWNGTEKFYNSASWMHYLVVTFLAAESQLDSATAPAGWELPAEFTHFTRDHMLNGVIEAQGEDPADLWWLVVRNNDVAVVHERPASAEEADRG